VKRGGGTASASGAADRLAGRRRVVLGALLLCSVGIAGRAAHLQGVEGEKWAAVAEEQQRARVPLPARRGTIYDRRGVALALTRESFQLSVAPREVRDRREVERLLATVLDLSPAEARAAVDPARRWVVLPGRYSAQHAQRLAGVRGIHAERRLERFYPHPGLAREVIGAVSGDDRPLGGIEQQFDGVLRGEDGYSIVRRDARGAKLSAITLPVVPARDGNDVHLTLDFDLQEIAEGALRDAVRETGASGGDLLMVDPRSGDVLAAASTRAGGRSLSAITEPYEPGSTLKPFLLAGLLQEGRISMTDRVDAGGGTWMAPGRRSPIRDTHRADTLTVADALRHSSNVVFAKLAAESPAALQYSYYRDFGFGTPTGIGFPSEAGGSLRQPARWSAVSATSLAMGYEIAVTPLQLTMAYAALANGGTLMEPRLVREVRQRGGTILRAEPRVVRRVVSPEVAREVTTALVSVVEEGTARRAGIDVVPVAGKTGTARRSGPGGRYETGSYTSTFVGFFPASEPQITILVKLDQPRGAYYGGLTAAPVSREALQAMLAVRDRPLGGPSLLASAARAGPSPPLPAAPVREGSDGTFVFLLDGETPAIEAVGAAIQVRVPELSGLPMRSAARRVHGAGLHVRLEGSGRVRSTRPVSGTALMVGDTLTLVGGG
jgi:cell division protein FtsI (penicillin-binding protein 3)